MEEVREFAELSADSFIVCEGYRNRPLKKVVICYVCREKDKCKMNLKRWKNWYKGIKK